MNNKNTEVVRTFVFTTSVFFRVFDLSFFSEVVKPETLWGLMLPLFTHTCNNEHNDCNNIGKHFEKFLGFRTESGNVVVCVAKSAENEGADNGNRGLPESENNKSNSHPAAVTESVVRPNAAGVSHNVLKTAKTRNSAADTGCGIAVFRNIYTCGVGGGGVFAHGTKIESRACAIEEE